MVTARFSRKNVLRAWIMLSFARKLALKKLESVFSPSFCREIPRRNRAIELGLRFLFQEIRVFEKISCGFLKCAFPRNSHFREDVVWLQLVFQEKSCS